MTIRGRSVEQGGCVIAKASVGAEGRGTGQFLKGEFAESYAYHFSFNVKADGTDAVHRWISPLEMEESLELSNPAWLEVEPEVVQVDIKLRSLL